MSYEAGTYVKGDSVKVATTAAKAVALVFEGYKLKSESVDESAPAASVSDTAPVQDVPSGDQPETPKPRAPRKPADQKD